jgi:hypothetical protein
MKKASLVMLIPILLFLYNCEKEKDKKETPSLNYAETLYGGCNNMTGKYTD